MLSRALSAFVVGIDARPIEVEVDIAALDVPRLDDGLSDAAVQKSRDRIKAH